MTGNQKYIATVSRIQTSRDSKSFHKVFTNFDVLLTVHLCIILVTNQINAQILVL